MRYVTARINKDNRDAAYRIYVTDALKSVTFNTAGTDERTTIGIRYVEMIQPGKVETRTPEEIIDSIRRKLEG